MKVFFYNLGYFLVEANRVIRFNPLSNLFSIIGTGLILFLLGLVLAGWSFGDNLIMTLQKEAEISVYFDAETDKEEALALANRIKAMPGVQDTRYIDENEAHVRMEELLGEEAEILELFDDNPFEAFLEVRIDLEQMDLALKEIETMEGIDYVRENREVLQQMKSITDGIKIFGVLIVTAVGITTLIIISHMIRQGIYNNKDQINTLRLLGAPDHFIGLPFVLAGTFLTLLGGVLAAGMIFILINEGYSKLGGFLPFIPLPPLTVLRDYVCMIILLVSLALGFIGSMFGVSSIRRA